MATSDTAPPWTLDPLTAAHHRERWPSCAERFDADDRVEYADQQRWRYDDPRPQSGYILAGRYCGEFPDCDHRGHQKYRCVRCALEKGIGYTDRRPYEQIRFSCPACRKVTYHNPVGVSSRLVKPYG